MNISLSVYKNERGEIEFSATKPELLVGTIPEQHFRLWLDGLNQLAEGSFKNKVFLPEITLNVKDQTE